MTAVDKAAIFWSIGIVAVAVGIAMYGASAGELSTGFAAPQVMAGSASPQTTMQEQKPMKDPFAELAEETKQKAQATAAEKEMMPAKEKEQMQMKEQEQKMQQKEPKTIKVSMPQGTSVPGCEETNECYVPASVTINKGDKVIWSNDDNAAHTVNSGTPVDGPDGTFDSGLVMAGATFEHTFDKSGSYDYFCMVHPWMTGNVQVK